MVRQVKGGRFLLHHTFTQVNQEIHGALTYRCTKLAGDVATRAENSVQGSPSRLESGRAA